jgi:peptide/nickel transport system permease protein
VQVLRTHVLRNALLPVVTMVGMDIGAALGGVIFIETVFGLPGLGGMLRQAVLAKDLPVILGVVTFTTLLILLLNLVIDLSYAFIDPRVRMTQSSPAQPRRSSAGHAPVGEPATTTG